MGRLTDVGPAGLVPAAWTVALAAHAGAVETRTLLIALVVMDALLALFFLTTLSAMRGPVLSVWQAVLGAGLLVNLPGTAALWRGTTTGAAVSLSLYGWLLLPAGAYVLTWRRMPDEAAPPYLLAAVGTLAGTAVYAAGHAGVVGGTWPVYAGLAVAGLGQTVGIVAAAVQNTR
jgi:hypothetical protein